MGHVGMFAARALVLCACAGRGAHALRATLGDPSSATVFPHFWENGINSPHSAITLRADWQGQMRGLVRDIGYNYTRIHAPFARDYSVAQGPNATSYFNLFATYDFLLSIGVRPWVELGYTPCWMSGPPAVPRDSYWPTVDYGICVGSPTSVAVWTDMISDYVGAMVRRYGLAEVERWVFVLFNEPAGVNAHSKEWESAGFSYYELFCGTSRAIKAHGPKIRVGGLSDSNLLGQRYGQNVTLLDEAAKMVALARAKPGTCDFDLFTYHMYCNDGGQTPNATRCGASHHRTVAELRGVLPEGMPIVLEETGSSGGPYDAFHDGTSEAAFVAQYIAAMDGAGLAGALWWVSSDIYTEHGHLPNYTWIPHQDYSGGAPRAEFTGRWGFITPSGVPKPIYRAFELLHQAGSRRIAVAEEGDGCGGATTALAVANGTDGTGAMVFIANTGDTPCNVTVAAGTWAPRGGHGWLHRIDATHGNPLGAWQGIGAPSFPTPSEVAVLQRASLLQPEPVAMPGGLTAVSVPGAGLAVIVM